MNFIEIVWYKKKKMQKTCQIYKSLIYRSIEITYYHRMVKKYICNINL